MCEAAGKETKQSSILMAACRGVNLIHIKVFESCGEKPERKSDAAFSQTADDLSETDIFAVEKSKKEGGGKEGKTSLLKFLSL